MSDIGEVKAQILVATTKEAEAITQGAEGYQNLDDGMTLMVSARDKMREALEYLCAAEEKFKDAARMYVGAGAIALESSEIMTAALQGSTASSSEAVAEVFNGTQRYYNDNVEFVRDLNGLRGDFEVATAGYDERLTQHLEEIDHEGLRVAQQFLPLAVAKVVADLRAEL